MPDGPLLRDAGERAVVAALVERFTGAGRMLGDDCAVIDMGRDYLLASTDMVTAGVHFPEDADPEDVGWYAAAVNLSDIAAMGGSPLGMLFALGLPAHMPRQWLDRLVDGIAECCDAHHAPVLGGDTKECGQVTVTGTAIGTVPKNSMLKRSGARPGDIVMMTGSVGRALLWELGRVTGRDLLRVEPRLEQGRALAGTGEVTACIDMSDGLSTSLHLIAAASGAGMVLDADAVPLAAGLGPGDRERAIHAGGDYELLFTVRPGAAGLPDRLGGVELTPIGRVTDEPGLWLQAGGRTRELPDMGYEHFSGGDGRDG